MPHIVADRVRETTTSTGTGPIALAGAAAGFRTFASVAASGDTVDIVIVHQTQPEWEVSTATQNADGTLTRTTVRSSSNSGAAVNFSPGTKNVFSTLPAGRLPADNVVGTTDTQTLTNKTARNSRATSVALGAGSGTRNLDVTTSHLFTATANGNCSWTFTWGTSTNEAQVAYLRLTNASGFTHTFTGVVWDGGTAPTISSAGTDLLAFVRNTAGATTVTGVLVAQGIA